MTTTETDQKLWHLSGNWTPMLEEITANDLKVEGNIPEENKLDNLVNELIDNEEECESCAI